MSEPLTDTQLDLIIHALGLAKCCGKRPRWAYRNYFESPNEGVNFSVWKAIEANGYAVRHTYETSTRFRLTDSVYPMLPEDIRKRIPFKVLIASNGEVMTGVSNL